MNEKKTAKSKAMELIVTILKSRAFLVALLVIAIGVAVWFGVDSPFAHEEETVRLGFENIGELATQEALATEVSVMEADRELFGISIPFTQSKYIFSYNVSIKAGYDFNGIDYTIDEEGKKITVALPQAEVLDCVPDYDSFQVYHESESVFQQFTLDDTNEAVSSLVDQAEADAIANGLLERARENAETLLTAFFAQAYDPEEYTVTFTE